MKLNERNHLLSLLLIGLASGQAHADLITTTDAIVDANTTTFSGIGGRFAVSGGPLAGVTLNGLRVTTSCLGTSPESACVSNFVYRDTGEDFFDNGRWLPGFAGIGAEDFGGAGGFKVDLGGNFSAVGAFLNYSWDGFHRDSGYPGVSMGASITALDENFSVLQTYSIRNRAPILGNPTYGMDGPFPESRNFANEDAGAFRGITSDNANIRYLMVTGGVFFAHSITVGSVPEPTTLGLLGFGLTCIGFRRARKLR